MASPRAERRFGQSSAGDRLALVREAVPKSTRVATDYWVGVFEKYCQERTPPIKVDFETVSASELACVLEGFYADVRRKDVTDYKESALLSECQTRQELSKTRSSEQEEKVSLHQLLDSKKELILTDFTKQILLIQWSPRPCSYREIDRA